MCARFSLHLASSVIGLQGHKDERKRLIETTAQQRNKSKTSSSMSVASTLYTRGYFAAPDHCRSVFFVRWTLVRRTTVNGTARTLCQRRTVNRALGSIHKEHWLVHSQFCNPEYDQLTYQLIMQKPNSLKEVTVVDSADQMSLAFCFVMQ